MKSNTGYRRLDAEKIIHTIEKLKERVGQQFPTSGLYQVSGELLELVKKAQDQSHELNKPVLWVWAINTALLALIGIGLIGVASGVHIPADQADFFEVIQIIEAGINDIVLIGAGIFFLFTMENRVKRARALRALHELRAITHVIDMHQITKDPMFMKPIKSGDRHVTQDQLPPVRLSHYLNHCTDMLSLTAKISALYIQHFEDTVVLASVTEIENLTSALSQKIWQKLMIIDNLNHGRPSA